MTDTADTQADTNSIIGTFQAQKWTGRKRDQAQHLRTKYFDATEHVLSMPLAEIQAIADNDETSDRIGYALVDHVGPCEVEIEHAITAFFGADSASEITQTMLDAKQRASTRPTLWQEHVIEITFTAPKGSPEAIVASAAGALRDTTERHIGGCAWITDRVRAQHNNPPAVLERRGVEAAFEIPEPTDEAASRALSSRLAGQGIDTLTDTLQAQFDALAGRLGTAAADKPICDALRTLVIDGSHPSMVDECRALRFIGDTARVCARDELGWYVVDPLEIDWQHLLDQWEDFTGETRVWPVRGELTHRVRVALFDHDGVPSVYELEFMPLVD